MTGQAARIRQEAEATEPQGMAHGVSRSLRLRRAGWILEQLDRRDMLVADAPRPESWGERDTIDAREFAQWLRRHLNVTGWRAIMIQVEEHNEIDPKRRWDISIPGDMLDAIELMLQREPGAAPRPQVSGAASPEHRVAVPIPPKRDHIVAEVQERANMLQSLRALITAQPTEKAKPRLPNLAWLLAPRSATAVVRAQATSAKAEAELERTRSETLLRALHIMENNLRSSAVLTQIQDLRQRLGPYLQGYCQERNIPLPQSGSEEEVNLLFLLNAQLVALDDAQEEIARRGAQLARDQIDIAEKSAKASLEARALPLQLETEITANPIRERLLREQMRHRSAQWVSRLVGALGGVLLSLITASAEMLAETLAQTAWLTAPALLVFFVTLLAETLSYSDVLTLRKIIGFTGIALWNATLILGLTLVGIALWRHLGRRLAASETDAALSQAPHQPYGGSK